jgi:hypothetical protein
MAHNQRFSSTEWSGAMNIRQRIFGNAGAGQSPLVTAKKPKGAKADMLHSIPVHREESRRGDTRLGDRYRIVGETARLTHDGSDYDAQLLNICGSGAMIRADFEPLPWDRVKLYLTDDRPLDCKVLWIRDGRIGLEFARAIRLDATDSAHASRLRELITRYFPAAKFDTPAEPQEQPEEVVEDDNRLEQRHPLTRRGTLHYDYQSTTARLCDVSAAGVMVETDAALAPGAEPLMELGEAGWVFGTVVWAVGGRAGLRFNAPFDWAALLQPPSEAEVASWEEADFAHSNADADSRWEEHWKNMTINELNEDLDGFLKR